MSNKALTYPSSFVYQEDPNNFTDGKQTIKGNAIASLRYSPMNPIDAGVSAERKGELYVEIHETDQTKEVVLWAAIEHNIAGVITYVWERVSEGGLVAYLDKVNDFIEANQTIKGKQIVTVVPFLTDLPTSSPDFEGQLAICRKGDDDSMLLFVGYKDSSGPLMWEEISPEGFAKLDEPNNFQDFDQKIKDNQIVSFINGGDQNPEQTHRPPQYNGQLYVAFKTLESGKPDVAMWIGTDVGTGKPTWLPILNGAKDLSKVAKLDMSNVFENAQQYLGPLDKGRMFVGFRQKTGGSTPDKDPAWIADVDGEEVLHFDTSVTPTKLSLWKAFQVTDQGAANWKMIWSSDGNIDTSNFAKLDASNNFEELVQTIGDSADERNLVGFRVKQGGTAPGQDAAWLAKVIGEETVFIDDSVNPVQTSIWKAVSIANPQSENWVEIWNSAGGKFDDKNYAKLDASNNFKNPVQTLGPAGQDRKITGCRVKTDVAPSADPNWKATVVGEETLFANTSATPAQYSLWKAIKVNPTSSNVGEWQMVWSSNAGPLDPSRVAFKDAENIFIQGQRIGNDSHSAIITTFSEGSQHPYDRQYPVTKGEMYMETTGHVGEGSGYQRKFYIARTEGDERSWQCIYDEAQYTQILADVSANRTAVNTNANKIEGHNTKIVALEDKVSKHGIQIDKNIQSIQTINNEVTTLKQTVEDLEGIPAEIAALKNQMDNDVFGAQEGSLNQRVHANDTNHRDLKAKLEHLGTTVAATPTTTVTRPGELMVNTQGAHKKIFMGVTPGHVDWIPIIDHSAAINDINLDVADHNTRVAELEGHKDAHGTTLENLTNGTKVGKLTINCSYEGLALVAGQDNHSVFASGYSEGVKSWTVGRMTSNQPEVSLCSYKYEGSSSVVDSYITLTSEKIVTNKPVFVNDDQLVSSTELEALDTRVQTCEAAADMLPANLTAGTYLVVNEAGNGFTTSTETVDEVNGIINGMVEGIKNGNQPLSVKCMGCDTVLTNQDITQSAFCSSNIVIGTPTPGVRRIINMGDIAPYQSTELASNQVREGCVIKIVNKGSGTMVLTPPEGIKLFDSSSSTETYDLASQKYVEVFPAIYNNGSKIYILVGTGPAH